jgi:hypothetical protein
MAPAPAAPMRNGHPLPLALSGHNFAASDAVPLAGAMLE